MSRSLSVRSRIALFAFLSTPLAAEAAGLLSPGDYILAIDNDTTVAPSGYAATEGPLLATDADAATQYRNTGGAGAGFIVTPWFGPSIVTSFTITTATEEPGQDPASWALYGTNDTIVSADNSEGNLENWTLIAADSITLPTDRSTAAAAVTFANATAYASYRMIFPTLRDADTATAMHIGEIQFDGTPVDPFPVALLQPTDAIIAIDRDPYQPTGSYNKAEFPTNVRDGQLTTKYLNFSMLNAGFIVTPDGGPSVVRSIVVTSANDHEERDPASFVLYGTNDPITSQDDSLGTNENWTQIASGALALPAARYTAAPVVSFANSTSYTSYKVTFPTIKNQYTANSMQVAEVGLYESTDGTGPNVLAGNGLILAVNADSGSRYTRAEFPVNIRDGSTLTKYLNYGAANSGFIATPAGGPSIVQSITMSTANDHEERDPTTYALYGTNAPIASFDNSRGNAEPWTLISSGSLSLPSARFTAAPVLTISNATAYASYKLVFPTLKTNIATPNSMQISEVGFFESTDGTGANLLAGDTPILAVDPDTSSSYPAAENPGNVRDGTADTKYLNSGKSNSGFIAVGSTATTVQSLVFTTANDHEERDPASYVLFGTNETVVSPDNGFGDAENWTVISSGTLSLPSARKTVAPVITFSNSAGYTSYKVVFPTIKNFNTANSMQIAEIGLFESTDGTGTSVLAAASSVLALDVDSASSYPVGERAQNVRDNNVGTKYANAGRTNTGFITTPSSGPSIVQSLKITTANDLPDRDPTSFVLYGTNDPIRSTDNSFGDQENWTFIASGPLNLPAARYTAAPVVSFANSTSYASYKLVFPTIKDLSATAMQISEVGLYASTDGTGDNVIAGTGLMIAIDTDSGSRYPVGQRPANVRDGTSATKYRNLGEENSGLIVTPSAGPSVVHSIVLTTADDQEAADPASYALYGTNEAITTLDNGIGIEQNWTLIASGDLALPAARRTVAPTITFTNETSYTSYKLLFPTVKDAATADSMQISEIGIYESTDGSGPNLLLGNGPILAVDNDAIIDSSYPAAEPPSAAIDGTTAKYLNFGKINSGFIVTPYVGATVVNGLRMLTANDAPERDPLTWELYGTTDFISSWDNSTGDYESWTLIASGNADLPLQRFMSGPLMTFSNQTPYTSYRLVIPTLRNTELANSMQIAEVWLYGAVGYSCNTPFADFDNDKDVDQQDFALLQRCYTGIDFKVAIDCGCADGNGDTHVDFFDVIAFQKCFTGPGILWTQDITPDCMP